MKALVKKLHDTHAKYLSAIGSIEAELVKSTDFDLHIEYQPADGFVVEAETHNAPLDTIIEHIKDNGWLTFDQYLEYCI